MNSFRVVGHFGQDPVASTTKNGKDKVQFNIAENTYYKDTVDTNWFPVIAYGNLVKYIVKNGHKGALAIIEGKIVTYKIEKTTRFHILAREIHIVKNLKTEQDTKTEIDYESLGETISDTFE